MTNRARGLASSVAMLVAFACQSPQDEMAAVLHGPTAIARATRLERALAEGDAATDRDTPLAEWSVPPALQEISGLALTGDERLLTHDDETGQVWEVDYRRGIVVKRFSLGVGALTGAVKGDFEGIAIANGVIFLMNSHGKLYAFREGADGARVPYTEHDTGLEKSCEFEGVAFDSAANALLLACKTVLDKQYHDALVIYRFGLGGDSLARLSPITVPLTAIVGTNGWKKFNPSDITIDPLTGNYVMVASQQNALISITPAGAVVFARALPSIHHQAEGIAISKDNILIVSDEAGQRPAIITLYRWP